MSEQLSRSASADSQLREPVPDAPDVLLKQHRPELGEPGGRVVERGEDLLTLLDLQTANTCLRSDDAYVCDVAVAISLPFRGATAEPGGGGLAGFRMVARMGRSRGVAQPGERASLGD